MTAMLRPTAEAQAAHGPFLQMCSGRIWSLMRPDSGMVHWPDIAEQLAKVPRFCGATPGVVYSVAQHCCLVADILPPALRPYGLLHDAPEVFSGDIPTPYKDALRIMGAGEILDALEEAQARAIHAAAGLPEFPLPIPYHLALKRADMVALATEHRDLQTECTVPWREDLPNPLPRVITPWPWPKAADEWLDRLYRWCPPTYANRSF